MRRTHFFLTAAGLVSTGTLIALSGCQLISNFKPSCEDGTGDCVSHQPPPDGGQHIDSTCEGNPTDTDPATMTLRLYNPACAVFAWAGATNPAPDGTMANPFSMLQDAVDEVTGTGKNKGKWVIACNKNDFTENVTATNSVKIYGGYDCSTIDKWAVGPAMTKTTLVGKDATRVTLTMQNGGLDVSVQLQDFSVTAPSAAAKGGSSIAMVVDDITASLMRCDVKAGDGMVGDDGQTPIGAASNGASAPMPDPSTMNACINPGSLKGGSAAIPSACDDGMSVGGAGGKGGNTGTNNGDGQPGEDGQPPDAAQGKGGGADTGAGCTDGTKGKDGSSGSPGTAGPAVSSPDTLGVTGLTGGNGGDGTAGTRGQGGGGGGARKSGTFCAGGADGNGASGGGAGAGGCGGKGGGGGKAGGSSIAIVSMGTRLTLTDVSLATTTGGNGGAGGLEQGGGAGGTGSTGGAASGFGSSKPGCKGGDGGIGGQGGPGGGGRGGHSIGIAYATTPAAAPTITAYTPGTPGNGGQAINPGAPGSTGACWDFAKKAACM